MSKTGPIILVEDDPDDHEILKGVLSELEIANELIWFKACREAWAYLQTTNDRPFIIICDINLPVKNGIQFKKEIDADPYLRKKSIPFIFYSTAVDQHVVSEAYTEITIQGFFQKPAHYMEIKHTLKTMIDYWLSCKHPNNFLP